MNGTVCEGRSSIVQHGVALKFTDYFQEMKLEFGTVENASTGATIASYASIFKKQLVQCTHFAIMLQVEATTATAQPTTDPLSLQTQKMETICHLIFVHALPNKSSALGVHYLGPPSRRRVGTLESPLSTQQPPMHQSHDHSYHTVQNMMAYLQPKIHTIEPPLGLTIPLSLTVDVPQPLDCPTPFWVLMWYCIYSNVKQTTCCWFSLL